MTKDRKLLLESEVVVFHIFEGDFLLSDLPSTRLHQQRYIFFTMEVPPNHKKELIQKIPGYIITRLYHLLKLFELSAIYFN